MVTKAGLTVLPLMLWVWVLLGWGVLDTTFFNKVCHWHMTGRWLSPSTPVSSINKTDRHDITEILLKVVINNINLWKIIPLQSNLVRDRPFNLKGGGGGGVWFFVSFRIFFSDNTIVRLFFFFCRAKRKFFFQNLTLGYMTKTLNQIFFFFLQQNQNIFLEKKHNPPPPFQVKWSFP